MNENVMSRTKAREIALHLIFEMGFQQFEPENLEERLDENIMRSLKTDAEMYAGRLSVENADYIRAVVKGVATHVDELDGVAINEAVALDKIYDTEEAAAFINGVLGAVAREKQEKDETDA